MVELTPQAALEAILFVAETPVPESELAEVLEVSLDETRNLLAELEAGLDSRGICLRKVAGGWRLYSRPDAFPYLERFSRSATARRISPAALEVLAIVAYRQPIARSQIAEIRGVDSDSAIRTLERLGLVEEAARLSTAGNPAVYRTSALFLEKLGVDSLQELPPLADHVPPPGVVEALEDTFRSEP